MQIFLVSIFTILSVISFVLFLRGKFRLSPLPIMLSAWFIAIAIAQLNLSELELPWTGKYWFLILSSLVTFTLGFFAFDHLWSKYPFWEKCKVFMRNALSEKRVRLVIYGLFGVSAISLYLFYVKAGALPLLAPDPDAFRFEADENVPGLINYGAQLARVFIPLSFFLMFWQKFSWKRHWDLVLLCLLGIISLITFASRTQIFFIDLWVMALYLFMRRPDWKQALKFYPAFLIISVIVLAAVPLYRQYQSYGEGYLTSVTGIDTQGFSAAEKAFMPIYVGVSFNQQALLHAQEYYETHPLQYGKVSLDPFSNIFGKLIPPLQNLKSDFDLGAIFYSWWNTGTYLFPFVQDFGTAAFFFVPFIIAGLLALSWHYWKRNPNFLSINLYAYAMFFTVMTVYLSFTVRAEMYLDLMLLFAVYIFVSKKAQA